MSRFLVVLGVLIAVAGCQSNGAGVPSDPFFGRTRVEPPRTGRKLAPPPDPYYSNPRQAVSPQPTSAVTATDLVPAQPRRATPGRYEPPGGNFNYQGSSVDQLGQTTLATQTRLAAQPGDRIMIPASAQREFAWPDPPAETELAASWPQPVAATSTNQDTVATGAVVLAGRERIVSTLVPRDSDSTASTSQTISSQDPRTPTRASRPSDSIDITDLPEKGNSGAATKAAEPGGIRLVSAIEEVESPKKATGPETFTDQDTSSRSASTMSRYGHASDYAWVRGKLEFSNITGQWKLRYIPVDGTTDDYGGSVVLSDTSLLSGYERGDFAEIHGKLGRDSADEGYAPEFVASQAKRIGN